MKNLRITNFVAIALGAALAGAGINAFNIANGLAEGGVAGVAVLLKLGLGLDPGLMLLLINLPLFLLGWRQLGRQSLIYTVFGTACLAASLTAFGSLRLVLDDLLLAALFAGAAVGVGLGVVFRFGGTTGGVDIIARIAQKHLGWPIGRTMLAVDMGVVGLSLVYLSLPRAMYTVVAIFVASRVIDFVQEAAYSARGVTIISDRASEVSERILGQMSRGVTTLQGHGGFSGDPKQVLYVVVSRSELVGLKRIIRDVDPSAFVAVGAVHEVLGVGFTLDEEKHALAT
jgi:uncharacterized membrane-anchored protein YitT (DUF2179 family)